VGAGRLGVRDALVSPGRGARAGGWGGVGGGIPEGQGNLGFRDRGAWAR
jgi:hypothetical protein